jgi:hypothetical protein
MNPVSTAFLVFMTTRNQKDFHQTFLSIFSTFEKAYACVVELLDIGAECQCYHIYEYEMDSGKLVNAHRYDT